MHGPSLLPDIVCSERSHLQREISLAARDQVITQRPMKSACKQTALAASAFQHKLHHGNSSVKGPSIPSVHLCLLSKCTTHRQPMDNSAQIHSGTTADVHDSCHSLPHGHSKDGLELRGPMRQSSIRMC